MSLKHLQQSNFSPTNVSSIPIYPLRIIKQIVAIFFSLNHENFNQTYPSLVDFILKKDNRLLDKEIHIYAYYNIQGDIRYQANVSVWNAGILFQASEITFPPLGLVMVMGSNYKPDRRLKEITWFTSYDYNDQINYDQLFNLLPTVENPLILPFDIPIHYLFRLKNDNWDSIFFHKCS